MQMTRQFDIDKHIKRLNGTVKIQFSKNFLTLFLTKTNSALNTVYC